MRAVVVLIVACGSSCGRLGFDPGKGMTTDQDARRDTTDVDGPPGDGPSDDGSSGADAPLGGCAAVQLAAWWGHTCAVRANGSAWCWGSNSLGELGDGAPTANRSTPVEATALGGNVVAIAVGNSYTCATKSDASMWCWGWNRDGQVGVGDLVDRTSPVELVSLGTSIARIATGYGTTLARKTDGTAWAWGDNPTGQIGDGTTTDQTSPVFVSALGSVVDQIATGEYHSCAVKTDGTLWCSGWNVQGELGDGTTTDSSVPIQSSLTGVSQVAVGRIHTCARKTDGTLWCWGRNDEGEVGDGTVVERHTPRNVNDLASAVAQVSAGRTHTCAVKTDGTLWCWGDNSTNQLDGGITTGNQRNPLLVAPLTGVAEVVAAESYSCARKSDGTVWCWGSNSGGQIGNGVVGGLAPITQVNLPCP